MKQRLLRYFCILVVLPILLNSCFKDDLLKEIDALKTQVSAMQNRNDSLNIILNTKADSLSKALLNAQRRSDSLSNILKTKSDSLSIALGITNSNLVALTRSVDSIKVQVSNINGQLTQLNSQLTSVNTQLTQLNQQFGALGADYAALNAKYQELSAALQGLNTQIAALQSEQLKLVEKLNAILLQLNPPVDITTGLVAYYPFSGNAGDSSGNGNHGTVNGATLTTDRFGTLSSSYLFNGSSNIRINNSSLLDLTTPEFTISNWILLSQEGLSWFINKSQGGGPGVKWLTEIITKNSKYTDPGGSTIGFQVGTSASHNAFRSFVDVQLNAWIHYTLVKKGNTLLFFFNGVKVSEQIINVTFQTNGSILYFGSDEGGMSTENSLRGKLDDIRIYNRALTQDQITYLATH